ncbi:MAG: M23 family metallopeptidase [Candidatus Andeanibacterium colombiense]|uniref:M23 family metallopeptidase n=1 Tax=Candidatus Andeanibacterium colombiense TaxID=3121345 RepID=A0AAJ5XCK7_9SPHN|nr:MAG: M23 family metallopeptidase [Sphingomonadaceae bacterium]
MGGAGAAVVQLSHAHVLDDSRSLVLTRFHSLSERYAQWRERMSLRLSGLDLAPDLAEDIGSARWFRGAGTMFALAAVALLFWPEFSPVEAAAPMHIDDAERDEFRSQMIMPLALGADSGRHMAPTLAVRPLHSAPERPRVELVATLAQGDSFGRMLERAGLGSAEAGQVASMIAAKMPLSDIESGTKVDIVLGRRASPDAPRPLDSLSFRARFDLELALQRKGTALTLNPKPIRVDATPLRIRGKVGGSLYRSARAAGAPAKAVQDYLRALGSEYDLDSSVGPNDDYDFVVSYKRAATGEVQVGDLLYAGVIRGGKPKIQLMRWGKDGTFFEASGVGEQKSGLLAPVANHGISSSYGMRRHPILGYSRMHAGIDFRASYGQPIYAVTDGRVAFAGRHGGHGNYVKLDHGGGFGTGYAHMSRIAVSPGQSVRRGQVIGYVGSTGLSTGPHLHYEMYRNGRTVNPSSVQFVTRATLAGSELARFRAQLAALMKVAPGAALASLVPTAAEAATPVREIDRADHPKQLP